MELEQGDVTLCTVDRIEGTVVFVKIEGNGEGSIITPEIAPGRIRNLRSYVVPKKKIVCKILRVRGDHIELSLRRVTQKERKEVMEKYKQEKSYISMLKSILGEKTNKIVEDISKEDGLYDFLEEAKENPKKLEKIVGKNDAKKIIDILTVEKQKIVSLKKEINLKTFLPNGIETIKEILGKIKNIDVKYISAGRYSLSAQADNIKKADQSLKEVFSDIEKNAKKSKMEFSIVEK